MARERRGIFTLYLGRPFLRCLQRKNSLHAEEKILRKNFPDRERVRKEEHKHFVNLPFSLLGFLSGGYFAYIGMKG
jgi:hypothetical protein